MQLFTSFSSCLPASGKQMKLLPYKVLKHPAISCITLLVQFFFCVDFQGLIPLLFLFDTG